MKGRVVIIRICSIHTDCINDMFCFVLFRRNRPCFPLCLLVLPQLARLNRLLNLNNTNFIPKLLQKTKQKRRIIEISFSCRNMNPCCALAPPCCCAAIFPGHRRGEGGGQRLTLCCFFPRNKMRPAFFSKCLECTLNIYTTLPPNGLISCKIW